MSIKLARMIRFDPALSVAEKMERIELMAEAFAEMSQREDLEFFCIGEQALYAILAGMLTLDNASIDDIIRVREKQFASMGKMMALAKTDEIFAEQIKATYKTYDMQTWLLNRLLNSPHSQFAKLRENTTYMEMLNKWSR